MGRTVTSIKDSDRVVYKDWSTVNRLVSDEDIATFLDTFEESKIDGSTITSVLEKDGKYIDTGDLTFGEYYKHGFEGYFPTFEDWQTHMSLFFPDVRLKTYLEIRNHDSQKSELITAVPAIWKGILYNKEARESIDDMFKGSEFRDFEELRYLTPDYGLEMKFNRYNLFDLAKEVLDISRQSHEEMKTGEEQYLEPIYGYVNKKITPADEIISRLKDLNEITVNDLKDLNIEII